MSRLAKMPLGLRVLAALLLGICIGILLPSSGAQNWSDAVVSAAHLAGQLWLAALQMTVLPLIFALLTIGLTASSGMIGDGGSVARRSLIVFAVLYAFCLIAAVALNLLLIRLWPISPAASHAFQKFAGSAVQVKAPGAEAIILSIMPSNIFGALAAGAIDVLAVAARNWRRVSLTDIAPPSQYCSALPCARSSTIVASSFAASSRRSPT